MSGVNRADWRESKETLFTWILFTKKEPERSDLQTQQNDSNPLGKTNVLNNANEIKSSKFGGFWVRV